MDEDHHACKQGFFGLACVAFGCGMMTGLVLVAVWIVFQIFQ